MMTQMETEMIDRYYLNYHISATQKSLEKIKFIDQKFLSLVWNDVKMIIS